MVRRVSVMDERVRSCLPLSVAMVGGERGIIGTCTVFLSNCNHRVLSTSSVMMSFRRSSSKQKKNDENHMGTFPLLRGPSYRHVTFPVSASHFSFHPATFTSSSLSSSPNSSIPNHVGCSTLEKRSSPRGIAIRRHQRSPGGQCLRPVVCSATTDVIASPRGGTLVCPSSVGSARTLSARRSPPLCFPLHSLEEDPAV